MTIVGEWQAFLVLLFVGFLPNEIWRMVGLMVGGGLDVDAEVLVWVRYVATAVLAGVIAQLVISPPGALTHLPPLLLYAAILTGVAVFFATRRSTFAGVVGAEIVLIAGMMLL